LNPDLASEVSRKHFGNFEEVIFRIFTIMTITLSSYFFYLEIIKFIYSRDILNFLQILFYAGMVIVCTVR